jgi:PilZ domain
LAAMQGNAMLPFPNPDSPANDARAAEPGERRATPRQACPPCEVLVVAVQPHFTALGATLRDVSTHGVGMVAGGGSGPGTVVALRLPDPRLGRPQTVLARVVHAAPDATGGWVVGCALAAPLAEDELRACLL